MKNVTLALLVGFMAIGAVAQNTAPPATPDTQRMQKRMPMGAGNTPGWSLMTTQERTDHREKMMGMKSHEECMAYHTGHMKMMQDRANEQSKKMKMPQSNGCDMMKSRRKFKP